MKKYLILLIGLLSIYNQSVSQNIDYARGVIDTLASPEFFGRGYVNSGDKIAADYIVKQFEKSGVKPFETGYLQPFEMCINTFPGEIKLVANGRELIPGTDFVVFPDAAPTNAVFKTMWLNGESLNTPQKIKKFNAARLGNVALIIDTGFKDLKNEKLNQAAALITITDKNVSWHVSRAQQQSRQIKISLKRPSLPEKTRKIYLKIDAALQKNYKTNNVVGYLPGRVSSDTFLVVGGHYDHLGMMGNKTFFPGANDNASGTAIVLDLARHFSDTANRPRYSVAFVLFAAEEAGLLGSEYFTTHPPVPLKNIKFMVNLDMVSTGSEGIKVVNGSVLKEEFEKLKSINNHHNYLKTISERGEAANSDHYFFYKNGVKSFFIYSLGDECKEYHTVTDKAAGLPLTKYNEIFKLVVEFINSF